MPTPKPSFMYILSNSGELILISALLEPLPVVAIVSSLPNVTVCFPILISSFSGISSSEALATSLLCDSVMPKSLNLDYPHII
jgi:hypothetical protein